MTILGHSIYITVYIYSKVYNGMDIDFTYTI